MAIPTIFTERGDDITALYDWYDAGLNAGYKRFYAGITTDSVSTKYFLTTKTFDGDETSAEPWQVLVKNSNTEVNFDLEFNQPVVIKGEALINYTRDISANGSSYTIFTFYHVNGSTETSIGTITTSTDGTTSQLIFRRQAKVTLAQTSFGVGEKLRIEVKMYETGNQNAYWYFFNGGRYTKTETGTGATITSDFIIDVPFKLQP